MGAGPALREAHALSPQPDQGHDRQGGQLPGPGRARPLPDHRRECPTLGRGAGPWGSRPLPSSGPHCSTPAPPQSTMLQAIERYMKQAIVDKVPSVSSSALVSSLVCSLGRDPGWGWGWSGD